MSYLDREKYKKSKEKLYLTLILILLIIVLISISKFISSSLFLFSGFIGAVVIPIGCIDLYREYTIYKRRKSAYIRKND